MDNWLGRLEERMKAAEAFLEVSNFLSSRPPFLVSTNIEEKQRQDTVDQQRYWRAVTSHLLLSIVFEVAIKVLWELENNKACRYTHDIAQLYEELSERSRRDIEALYLESFNALANRTGTSQDGTKFRIGQLVQLQSLNEALEANEDAIKNFKYDIQFKGKSSIFGDVIWNEEIRWVLPRIQGVDFPRVLFSYISGRITELG